MMKHPHHLRRRLSILPPLCLMVFLLSLPTGGQAAESFQVLGVIDGLPGRGLFLAASDGCSPIATQKADVIDCTGSVDSSIHGKGGRDTVTVVGGASITVGLSSDFTNATGVDGGHGNDTLVNEGEVNVSSDGLTAISTGMSGGQGDDTISNLSTLDATGTAVHSRTEVELVVGGSAQTEAGATATGIGGGDGKDTITNAGSLTATASAQANTNNFSINVDFGSLDATTKATATATGIAGGTGGDTLTNTNSIEVSATAEAQSLGLEANGADIFEGKLGVAAEATAVGISGEAGGGSITNSGNTTVTANATAFTGSAEVSFFDRAEADATTSSVAKATGIHADQGSQTIVNGDEITKAGSLNVTATAESTALGVVVGIKAPPRLIGGPESKFIAAAAATATGVASGGGNDTITNHAETQVTATASGFSLNGTYEKDGAADVEAVAAAHATATGLDGGAGDDTINNHSTLTVKAESTSHAVDVAFGQAGDLIPIPSIPELIKGKPPETDAQRIATAHSTGIDSGAGNDVITNTGAITADAASLGQSAAVSVSVEIEDGDDDKKKGGKKPGKIKKMIEVFKSVKDKVLDLDFLDDAAIDTSVRSHSTSVGLSGGDGHNTVTNDGSVKGSATATTFSTSALLDFTISKEKDPKGKWFIFKPGLAQSQATAAAAATGISSGSGNDTIVNNDEIDFTATATANSLSITAINQPKLKGVGLTTSMSDTSTITSANATGITSGGGNDTITNSGTVSAKSESKAFAESIAVNVEAEGTGLEIGAGLTNSNTVSQATSVGIDAGSGNDFVENTGTITAEANARANSLSGSVSVQGAVDGVGVQAVLSNSMTTATANAAGIATAGQGRDTLVNLTTENMEGEEIVGTLNVKADARAFAESVSVGVQLGGNGLEISGALTRADTTADAQAVGIESAGNESVVGNGGNLTVDAVAKANSLGISVDVQTGVDGLGIAGALSETATKTNAIATGIENSGAGNEQIGNSGTLTTRSDSRAFAESVGVNIQMGGGGVSAGAALTHSGVRADAAAAGIDAGLQSRSVVNSGDLSGAATAVGNSLGISFGFQGNTTGVGLSGALSDAKTESYATGVGISSRGPITSGLINSGIVTGKADAQAYSEAASINIQAGGTGLEVGAALARAGTLADASARGLELAGGNEIDNYGTIKADADAATNSFTLGLAAQGSVKGVGLQGALTDSETIARARATAAHLSSGSNTFTQFAGGETIAEADSAAAAESISVTFSGFSSVGATIGAALARSGVQSEADAVGFAGGAEADTVTNMGSVTATSNAGATALGVSAAFGITQTGLGAQGAAVDAAAESHARSTGVTTGSAIDTIENDGVMDVSATATTHATTVSAGVTGTTTGVALGAALTRATTEANAGSAAIESGAENDQITNRGTVTSTATVESKAVGVAAGLGVVQSGVAIEGTAADTSTKGDAQAALFNGGAGDDRLENDGAATAQSTATVNSTSVSIQGTVTMAGLGVGAALGRATTEGDAGSSGMSGNAGNDTVINNESGSIVSTATVNTRAVGALVGIGFTQSGVALSGTGGDTSARGSAAASGMAGGAGNDTLDNDGNVEARSTSNVDSAAVSVNLSGTVTGVSIGAALARAKTEGATTSAGISGEDGDDTLTNNGTVSSEAHSIVKSVGVSVGAGVTGTGVAVQGALVDGSAQGLANATGVTGGAGLDDIYNQGAVDATSTADVTTTGVSVSGSGTVTGVGAGVALSRAATLAVATATGIAGDAIKTEINDAGEIVGTASDADDSDFIENRRSVNPEDPHGVTATAKADADAASVSVAVGLTGTGVQAGGALADLHNHAAAKATGISGGGGDDTIHNDDTVTAEAEATTTGASVSVSLQGTVAGVAVGVALTNAATKANATGTAISGDDGVDTIVNTAAIGSSAKAQATATSVAVSAPIAIVPLGVALSDSSAEAEAQSYGVSGGAGDDTIDNQGAITVGVIGAELGGADAKAIGTSASASVLGASIGDANAIARSTAVGIEGGAGEDTIGNTAGITTTAKSKATGTSVTVALAGASIGDARGEASATASGVRGGADRDIIVNSGNLTSDAVADARGTSVNITFTGAALGNILRDSRTTATAVAHGIEGNEGDDDIFHSLPGNGSAGDEGTVDSKTIKASASATASDVSVNIVLPGPTGGAAIGKVGTSAHATATGIDGGAGEDAIESNGKIDLSAVASAPGASVNVNLQAAGAALADGRTSAEAAATGISGGAEKDSVTLRADSVMIGVSDAKTGTTGVSVNLIGATSVNANIDATARGTGIDGGDGDDTLTNLGSIDWTALSDARASSVSINLVGAALGGATTLSSATATGIAGAAGEDTIENHGTMTLTADAKTTSGGVTVSLAGHAAADSNIQAVAEAVGIDGGSGKDTITSRGAIQATATADAPASSVDVNIAGTALGDARTSAQATSIGLQGGGEDDTLRNFSTIEAASTATTSADDVSVVIAGLASSSKDVLTATARSSGIAGGEGADDMYSAGDVTVSANATTTIGGSTVNIFGVSQSGGTANANVTAVGLDGGAGDDGIHNFAKLTVGSTGTMTIDRGNFEFGGVASAEGSLISSTSATGIAGGAGADSLYNQGDIEVTSSATLTATGNTTAVFGAASAGAALTADATAIGMDGGKDTDVPPAEEDLKVQTLSNTGTLTVTSAATMTSARPSFTVAGSASADALLEAVSQATGIAGSAYDDAIYNSGTIEVAATSSQTATGGSKAVLAGGGTASATSNATAMATGVDGGPGNHFLVNDGTIRADANPSGTVTNNSNAGFLFGSSGAISEIDLTAKGRGARFGDGVNTIFNNNLIDVRARSGGTAASTAHGADIINGDTVATATATVNASAYGILLGDGANPITNHGTITVLADPSLTADAHANGNGADGDGTATATATVTATAVGIQAGGGNNQITNNDSITVNAKPSATADSFADSDAGGTARSTATATATATAVGIRAGDGDNWIINHGTLTVTAMPTGNATATGTIDQVSICIPFTRICATIQLGNKVLSASSPESGTAIGIDTGSGNDTIVNHGVITATRTVEDVASNGVAIRSGAGNDTVVLGNGSATTGSIELGEGDDTLHLIGSPIVNGNIASGSGANSLVFEGTGSFANSLSGFVNALKQGAGTYTLPGLPAMTGKLEVRQGTLQLNSDYQMAASSTFQTTVNGDGSHGQLKVGGAAGLDGALVVDKGPGAYVNGTTYDVVSASSVTGGFISQQLPDSTALLSFSTNQTSTAFQVQANVAALSTVARNPVGAALAKVLDGASIDANSDLGRVVDDFQQLSQRDFNRGFSSLSHESYHPFSAATLNTLQRYSGAVHTRMNIARAMFRGKPFAEAVDRTDLAQETYLSQFGATPLTFDLFHNGDAQKARQRSGFWLSGFGNTMAQNEEAGFSGFQQHTSGIPAGFDVRLSDRLIAGVAATQSHGTLNFQDERSAGRSEGVFTTVYGTYFTDHAELEALFSYGRDNYRNVRRITLGGLDRRARSEHDGDIFAARFEGRYHLDWENLKIEPFASLQYSRQNIAGFRETGAGDLDLIVNQRSVDALASQLGLRLARSFSFGAGLLIPELTAAWQHDFRLGDSSFSAFFRGAPQDKFRITAPDDSGGAMRLGGALTFIGNRHFSAAAGVNAALGKNKSEAAGLLQLQWRW